LGNWTKRGTRGNGKYRESGERGGRTSDEREEREIGMDERKGQRVERDGD
jgi:hypothetical protein